VDDNRGELDVAKSRPIEGHEQPIPSLEPDMIDNLVQPTAYNLFVMVVASN
jgi:hypothetical protein